jgi:hypothetical protein
MSMCSVSPCSRSAVVAVTYATSPGREYHYCGFHGYRNGELRWKPDQIARARRL